MKSAVFERSGRINDGQRNAANHARPKNIIKRERCDEYRLFNCRSVTPATSAAAIYPHINVVSCMIGKTERLNGKNPFPRSWSVAGRFVINVETISCSDIGSGFVIAIRRSGSHTAATSSHPAPSGRSVDLFNE